MNTMKKIKIENDIKIFYIQAKSFPDGVLEAFQKMHSLIEFPPQRRNFGISQPENGEIVYKVASEELIKGDLEKHNLKGFIIPHGEYIGTEIKGFRDDLSSIKKAFDKLLESPDIDKNGYCIEEYKGTDDVFCMVRLKDK